MLVPDGDSPEPHLLYRASKIGGYHHEKLVWAAPRVFTNALFFHWVGRFYADYLVVARLLERYLHYLWSLAVRYRPWRAV